MKHLLQKHSKYLWLSLLLLLVGATAIAIPKINGINEGNVARIGSTEYATLQAAVDAIPVNGTEVTLTLLQDVTVNSVITIPEGSNVKLDFAGNKIVLASNWLFENNGSLTLNDSGSGGGITFSSNNLGASGGKGCVDNYGTLTVNAGNYETFNTGSGSALYNESGATMTINGGTVNAAFYAVVNGDGNLTINGGTMVSSACSKCDPSYAYCVSSNGTFKMTNGTIKGVHGGLSITGGTSTISDGIVSALTCTRGNHGTSGTHYALYVAGENAIVSCTVNGGSFSSTGAATVMVGNSGDGGNKENAALVINDGTFKHETGGTVVKVDNTLGNPYISGGTFNGDVSSITSDYLAEGFTLVDNGDGTYSVSEPSYVAQIGSTKYVSLAEAIAAVPDGTQTTITMIDNEAMTAGVTIAAGQNIVLELNGKTISETLSKSGTSALITNNGTLTIQDNTDTNKDGNGTGKINYSNGNPDQQVSPGYASNTIINQGNLTIESGYIENTTLGGYAAYTVDNLTNGGLYTPVFTMNGGKLYNSYTDALRMFLNSDTKLNKVVINGGVLDSDKESGRVIVFQGSNAKNNKGQLDITGGEIKGTISAWAGTSNYQFTDEQYPYISISITGGYIEELSFDYMANEELRANSVQVTGGTFKVDPSAYVAEGYAATDNTDPATNGTYPYTVQELPDVAQIGEVKYKSLAEAVAAVPTDGTETTITMIDDASSAQITVGEGKKVIIDFAGFTVTPSEKWLFINNGDLTFNNTTTESSGGVVSEYKGIVDNYGKLTVNGGTYSTSVSDGIVFWNNNTTSSISVTGGTVSAPAVGIVTEAGTISITGGTVSATGETSYAIQSSSSTVNVSGGTVSAVTEAIHLESSSTATISGDAVVKVTGESTWGIVVYSKSTLTVQDNATIQSNGFAISGNGSAGQGETTINIEGGTITGGDAGIYQPQSGSLNITGGTITGATGVYVKSGELSVTGGEINGTGAKADYNYNGNGADPTGDALVIDNCGYPGGVPVVSVTGGKFTSTNATPIGSYAQEGYEPLSNFVSGGYFNKELDADLCATGKKTAPSTTMTGYYEVVEIVYVAQIGDVKYETLGEAFTAAANGSTITLLTDVELTDRLFVNAGATPAYAGTNNRYATTSEDKSITLDLNGNNITSSSNIALAGGSLNIVNNGTADATHGVISTSNSGLAPIEVRGTGDLTSKRTLTIGENVTLKGGEYGLNIFGSNDAQKNIIEVTVNGKVEGDLFVLGNLTNDDNNILITVNGSVDASGIELGAEKAKTGVALNGNAKVVVNDGASVKGETAIEVRAGELTVNGGTITGTASEYSYTPNGSGTTVKGVAIAVAPYNAEKDLRVTVSDGTLSGAKTIAVVDVQNNLEKVTVKAKDDFVDGADETVIPESYKWVSDGEGMSTLTPRDPIVKIGETVYYSLAAAVAAVPTDGTETTIELLANVTENVVVKDGKNIVLDLGEKTLIGYIDQYDSNITLTNGNLAGTFYVNGGPSSAEAGYNKFTLAADATITSDWGFILYQGPNGNDAYGSTIDINGTINGTAWVMGNITEGNSVINVNNGATIDGDVFGLNGLATLNVKAGATIIGAETGIEVRAGNLNVEGGTITSTSTEYKVESNGSGTTTYGAAIAVAQHTTGLPINANITGGTLSGIKTISVADPEGGNYAGVVVTAKDELTEGEVVIPDGYIWISNNDGTSTLTKAEHGEYVLIDGEDYPFMNLKSDISVPEVTYKRSFSEGQINKHQAWFVPMDYTITADDAENFTFYKIQMIAGAAEAGEADHDKIYLYIEPMSEGEVLKGNRPYTVKPKNAVSNYEFTADGTKLYAPNTGSRLNVTTSFHSYDFYGKYARESYSGSVGDMFFLSGGSLHPNNATTTLLPYRWIIKVTANTINDDYSKIEFSIVEDGDATGIDRAHIINSDEVEGIYTTNGLKVDEPVRGINIIRYKNGKTEKIIVK